MSDRYRICFVFLAVFILAAGRSPQFSMAESRRQNPTVSNLRLIFDEGNKLYGEGDYEGAIKAYLMLVEMGVEDKDLYYDLGNAYFKNGEMGRAVLFYERSLRLSPRDEETKENLALVKSMLRDRQFIRKENRFKRALLWMNRNFNTGEAVLLASLFYIMFCFHSAIYIFRKSVFVFSLYGRFSIFSPGRFIGLTREQDLLLAVFVTLCLFIGSGASAYQKVTSEKRRARAVVIEQEAAVYSGPTSDATLQFKIHEGTQATIRVRRSGWRQIDLPGDLSGWVKDHTIEAI